MSWGKQANMDTIKEMVKDFSDFRANCEFVPFTFGRIGYDEDKVVTRDIKLIIPNDIDLRHSSVIKAMGHICKIHGNVKVVIIQDSDIYDDIMMKHQQELSSLGECLGKFELDAEEAKRAIEALSKTVNHLHREVKKHPKSDHPFQKFIGKPKFKNRKRF